MKSLLASGMVVVAALGCYVGLEAQVPAPASTQTSQTADSADSILLPAGTPLGLELQDSLNTKYTKKGDRVSFKVSPEVLMAGRVAIPKECSVDAMVALAKRGGLAQRKGEIQLAFDRIVLDDGTVLPLAAKLTRVGRWNRSDKITQAGPSDRNVWRDLAGIGQAAAVGAGLGELLGNSAQDAAIGAAAGVGVALLGMLLERGPELDLPPGIMFQVELTKPLRVPVAAAKGAQQISSNIPIPTPTALPGEPPAESPTLPSGPPKPPGEAVETSKVEVPVPVAFPAPTIRDASPTSLPAPPADLPAPGGESAFKISVEVNRVMVEATVRDERGAIYIKLKREDFLVAEDGVQQELLHFSRDELPLAVALVIDRSGSVAQVMDQLRRAAYETLSQLKEGDEVALMAFAEKSELIEGLTADRRAIAGSIAEIQAGGGTNIKDALLDAAEYLGRAAPKRRHAIILISDNQETVASRADKGQVIRTALETESVVYSIKVEDRSFGDVLTRPILSGRAGAVKEITQETGGEIFETRELGSVEAAMQAVVSRLKLRFTLGYQSANQRHDGAFRKIAVRLTDKEALARGCTVYARRGYYAPKPGAPVFPTMSTGTPVRMAAPPPPLDRPASPPAAQDVPRKHFTNDDILKLVKGGFGEETILEAIRTNDCRFDTSADALLALKNAGVGEKVIIAMLAGARPPAAPTAPIAEADALPAQAGVYLMKDGKYVRLEFDVVEWRSPSLRVIGMAGTTKTTLKASMEEPKSRLRLSGALEFLVVCPTCDADTDYRLLRAEANRKGREFQSTREVSADGSQAILIGTSTNNVQFSAEQLAVGRFKLKLPELAKGEYAFLPPTQGVGGRLYTFGVP